jgi:Uma2 family endonuclease
MTAVLTPRSSVRTMADLLHRLGVGPERVRAAPPPGSATEDDLIAVTHTDGRRYELVGGVLVEKAMGYRESILAMFLGRVLLEFVQARNLGLVTGEQGMIRLQSGLVRGPDVAFTPWSKLPGGVVPAEAIPDIVPDLAVEVLSIGNTELEMARKRHEYFGAGVRVVWLIDPRGRTVRVYSAPEEFTTLTADATLEGGVVLPGFSLPLQDLFGQLDLRAES